jgi:hypothetical protein
MQDDLRADMLFRALTGEELTPSEADDEELRALVGMGARLEAMRPALVALAGAEDAFNPTFAQELHRTLIAAHPAVPGEQPAVNNTVPVARRTVRWMSRRFIALLVLIAALVAIAVTIIVQDNRSTALVGTAALSPTRAALHITAKSFAANAPRHSPVVGRPQGSPTAQGPAPLSVGAPPTAGKTPTPAPTGGATAASGASPMHADTFAPPASPGPGPFRYRLPSTLPAEPASVPVYRVLQGPTTKAHARAIAATFAGMQQITGTTILSFTGNDALLRIIPTSGIVDYTRISTVQGSAAITAPLSKTREESIARKWLVTHRLLPKTTGLLTASVRRQGTLDAVQFTPTLQLPLLAGAPAPRAVVEVDGRGNVMDAHVAWAKLQPTGTAKILSPAAATAGPGASKARQGRSTPVAGPEVEVTHVILAYEPVGQDDGLILRPVYQLTGTLKGQPIIQFVPASRNGT